MLLNPFTRRSAPHLLAVSMTGVKMGDRVAFVGCANGGRVAAVASKVGLSGRAVAIVPDGRAAELARKGAEQLGVLVEIEVASPAELPIEDGAIDLAVVDDTGEQLGLMRAEQRVASVCELARILRPGGRVILVGAGSPAGLGKLFTGPPSSPPFSVTDEGDKALETNGFGILRPLAEPE